MSILTLFYPQQGAEPQTGSTTTTLEHSINPPTVDKKGYLYKVYGAEGNLVGVWRNEVINEPTFRSIINGGDTEITVKLERDFTNFGEGVDVDVNYDVELYIYDKESPQGQKIFSGYIIGYTPILDGNNEFLEVTVRSNSARLADRILRNSSDETTLSYNSQDPSDIFKDIVDKFRNNDNGNLNYTANSVETTGTTVSYTFNTNTYREALDKLIELAPEGWYWRADPDGTLSFKSKSDTADHNFSVQAHLTRVEPERNIEDLYNEVYFIGGDTGSGNNLYIKTTDSNSVSAYGRRIKKVNDGRVTTSATAETISDRIINEKKDPARRTRLTVVDSNGSSEDKPGYNIESIKVGQVIQVYDISTSLEPTKWDSLIWDQDVWDNQVQSDPTDRMQVVNIRYSLDEVQIEATTRLPEISKRIEDINRNMESNKFVDNPTAPS